MHSIARSTADKVATYRTNLAGCSFLLLLALVGAVVSIEQIRIAVADRLAGSGNVESLAKASRIDPQNPDFEEQLGLLFGLSQLDETSALTHLRKAISLNRYNADYWSELGRQCITTGDRRCSDEAFENAVRLAPTTPSHHWEIANYYLITDRLKLALPHFRHFLDLGLDDPKQVFEVCLRASEDPELIWRELLSGAEPPLKLLYLKVLSDHHQDDVAFRLWKETLASGVPFSFLNAAPYLSSLMFFRHFDRAVEVWHDLEQRGMVHDRDHATPNNLVFNGGFEQLPLAAGFDWQQQGQEYLAIDFADPSAYQGDRCLRADFTVPHNADFQPVFQVVPVLPSHEYRLAAFARSADLTSDSGPRLVIQMDCAGCGPLETAGTVGTTPWHEISLNFKTTPDTHALTISLWRPRSRTFPMEIQGQFWLDSVSLTPVAPADDGLSETSPSANPSGVRVLSRAK